MKNLMKFWDNKYEFLYLNLYQKTLLKFLYGGEKELLDINAEKTNFVCNKHEKWDFSLHMSGIL